MSTLTEPVMPPPAAVATVEQPAPVPIQQEVTGLVRIPRRELVSGAGERIEKKAEVITLSQETSDSLAAITAECVESLSRINPTLLTEGSFQKVFLEEFKKAFPKVDFSDPAELLDAARKFVLTSGTHANLAIKMSYWAASLLDRGTGVGFERTATATRPEEKKTGNVEVGPEGVTVLPAEKETPSWWRRRFPGRQAPTVPTSKYKLREGTGSLIGTRLNPLQLEFVKNLHHLEVGNLTPEQKARVGEFLIQVAGIRTEVSLKTGLPIADINLDFSREVSSIEADASRIVQEVRTATETKLKNAREEARKAKEGERRQSTAEQIQRRIEELEKELAETNPEARAKKEREIAQKKDQLEQAKKKRTAHEEAVELDKKIPTLQTELDEAKTRAISACGSEARLRQITERSGDDSLSRKRSTLQAAQRQLSSYDGRITSLQRDLEIHYQHRPATTQPQTHPTEGGIPILDRPGIPVDTESINIWNERLKHIQTQLDEERGNQKKLIDQVRGLEDQIAELDDIAADSKAETDDYLLKKKACESAIRTLEEKKKIIGSEPNNDTQLAIETQISNIQEDLKKLESADESQKEIEILRAVLVPFTAEGYTSMQQRIDDADTLDLEFRSDLNTPTESYPKIVLRAVQLIWGDDVLQATPKNNEQAARVMAILRSTGSDSYLMNIADTITRSFEEAGLTAEVDNWQRIDRRFIENIVEALRIKALQIETIKK